MSKGYAIVLVVLVVLGLACGYFGGLVYHGFVGSIGGMTTACRVLQIGEQAGVLTKAQRGAIVEEVLKGDGKQGSNPADAKLREAMTGNCSLF